MQWIEQLFGCSPDGGTGLTEIALLLSVLTAVVFICLQVTVGVRKPIWKQLLRQYGHSGRRAVTRSTRVGRRSGR